MSNVDGRSTAPVADVVPPAEKRSRNKQPLSVSPTKSMEKLQNFPGGCCIKCKECLDADSKAIQCGSWIHGACESVPDDVYDSVNVVLGSANNFVYYCEMNNCMSRIKQLLFSFFTGNSNKNPSGVNVEKPTQSQAVAQQSCLSDQLNDLAQKITDLSSKQQTLHNSMQILSSKFVESVTTWKLIMKLHYNRTIQHPIVL